MRQIASFLLAIALLVSPCLAEPTVRAGNGDPNIDGGADDGIGDGSGNSDSAWNPGDDGVRVTILQGTTPISILDYSNTQRSRVERSFVKNCKLFYKNGGELQRSAVPYTNIVPGASLPDRIISATGESTIDAIRSFFTDKVVLTNLAYDVGMTYESLISGEFKLFLEPISYFKFKGVQYAMTATEAALFDVKVDGQLKLWMGKLTHQSQPFSMFLERPDLGIQPWRGGTSGKQSNIDILNFLGVGIVSFSFEDVPQDPPRGDYVYRTDTDVVTAVLVYYKGRYNLTPESDAFVHFKILGKTYSRPHVSPTNNSQLIWVKWHTPATPQTVEIEVTGEQMLGSQYITAAIVDLKEKEPPDPTYYDTNPGLDSEQAPDWNSNLSATWSEWVAIWVPPEPPQRGYWKFEMAEYSAALTVDYSLQPDSRVRTAVQSGVGKYEMKSGYGVNINCSVQVAGSGAVSNYDVTPVQNIMALFPEFGYKTYNRLLQTDMPGYYSSQWQFKPNRYSYYKNPTHFTPLWYPDGRDYTVPLAVFDVWTPGGMLYASVSDSIDIDGSVYDDWYIRELGKP